MTGHDGGVRDDVVSGPALVLAPTEAAFLAAARVGRLATVTPAGQPHLVPVCFATRGAGPRLAALYIALDEKPKRVAPERLQRVRNLVANPAVSLLLDRYDDSDWSRLAYLRLDGEAALLMPGEAEHAGAVAALRGRYPQYRAMALDDRPVIRLTPRVARSWGPLAPEVAEAPELPAPRALPFDELVRARRSVRRFRPDPVPRPLVERLIEAAGWAPSPHGRQPWRFAVVTRPALKEELVTAMGAAWLANLALDGQDEATIAARLAGSRRRVEEAPVLIVACLDTTDLDVYPDAARQAAEETMAVQSLGAAVQNLLLAAHDYGLDAGWMCAPLFCPDVVRDVLDLGAPLRPHALITVGYAAQDPRRRGRLPVARLIARYD